ncbi:hypothetical protein N8Z24_00670 [bacterium]|nr:hypothetical protein [bacterium]
MGELPTREEFSRLTVEEKRNVLKRAEFRAKPLDEKRKIITDLENAEKTGVMEAVGRGFGQGLTFNTLDEMMGGVRGALRAWESGSDLKKAISEETEIARRGFRKSERERPIATGVGQVAGAVLPTALAPASAIPRTVLGRVGAGAAGGALAGAGKAEQGIGTKEFKHHVKTGALTGGVAQGGFNLGKLVIGKTGKAVSGALGAISKSIPRPIKGVALKAIPGPMKAGFNKTIKLMENGDLPPEQSGRLMRGLRSGGAGLASAYIDLINEDVEFARQVQGERKNGLSSIIPDQKKNDMEERIRSDLFNHPIPKSLEKSTASGRAQSFMDGLIGADKIGLDPGEKAKGGQPTSFDEDLVAILPLFGGITKKITNLNPEKIKEMLEKKGKKLGKIDEERLEFLYDKTMSPKRKEKILNTINETIDFVRDLPKKQGPSNIKLKTLDNHLDSWLNSVDQAKKDPFHKNRQFEHMDSALKYAKKMGFSEKEFKDYAQKFDKRLKLTPQRLKTFQGESIDDLDHRLEQLKKGDPDIPRLEKRIKELEKDIPKDDVPKKAPKSSLSLKQEMANKRTKLEAKIDQTEDAIGFLKYQKKQKSGPDYKLGTIDEKIKSLKKELKELKIKENKIQKDDDQ